MLNRIIIFLLNLCTMKYDYNDNSCFQDNNTPLTSNEAGPNSVLLMVFPCILTARIPEPCIHAAWQSDHPLSLCSVHCRSKQVTCQKYIAIHPAIQAAKPSLNMCCSHLAVVYLLCTQSNMCDLKEGEY